MSNLITSPEYESISIPDVTEAFRTVQASLPNFLSLVGLASHRVKNHEHKWLEYKKAPKSWLVKTESKIKNPFINLVSTQGLKVGSVLGFTQADGRSLPVKAKVLGINKNREIITIKRLGPDTTIPAEASVFLISYARQENSQGEEDPNEIPTWQENYTQIFRRDVHLSRTLLQTELHGLNRTEAREKTYGLLNFQIFSRLRDLAYELNQSVLQGIKEKRLDGGGHGMLGGVLPFLTAQESSQYDASNTELQADLINNAIEQAVSNGANYSDLRVIACHPKQGRKFSSLNRDKLIIERADSVTGNQVLNFRSDLPGFGGVSRIVLDANFPQDQIALLSPDNLELLAMEPLSVTECCVLQSNFFRHRKYRLIIVICKL